MYTKLINIYYSFQKIQETIFLRRSFPLILWKYIVRDFLFSFTITLVFFVVIFIFNQLLLLTKDILQIEIPFIEVIKLIFFALPNILSLSIPFATLVACLMSVGHFSTFNEFVAMRANGISYMSSFIPYIFFACIIMLFSIIANEILLPWGTINFSKQYRHILSLNPQLGLEQNSIKRYQDDIIITKRVNNQEIQGVIILDQDSSGDNRMILADKARLKSNAAENGIISIELHNINSLSTGDNPKEYNYFLGDVMLYNILLKDLTLDVKNITPDQQSMKDLYIYIKKEFRSLVEPQYIDRANVMADMTHSLNARYQQLAYNQPYYTELSEREVIADNDMLPYFIRLHNKKIDRFFNRSFRITEIVFFRKLAFPIAVILFVLIAFPMGLFYKRSGRTVGFGVGLILSFVYWFLIVLNQSIGINSFNISAFFIMWYPNMLMLLLGILLFLSKRYTG